MGNRTLGEKLRWLRATKGLSQADVANGLDISTPAYHKIERGLTDCNLTRIKQLAEHFEVNTASLILEDEPAAIFGNERITELEQEVKEYQVKVMELQTKVLALYEEMAEVFG